jgi:hypothetical protein
MSGIATAVIGSAVIGGIASRRQSRSADQAAVSQERSAQLGIEEQRRQFDTIQALLKPYTDAGTGAIGAQGDLLGTNGPEKQAAAIEALRNSPEFEAITKQGEEGILQNASATGGLRGGNTQDALGQFRPAVLSSLIESQFNRLGTIANMGQASAAGVGSAAQNTGNNVTELLAQQGQARAGAQLARGNAQANALNGVGNSLSTLGLLKAFKVF